MYGKTGIYTVKLESDPPLTVQASQNSLIPGGGLLRATPLHHNLLLLCMPSLFEIKCERKNKRQNITSNFFLTTFIINKDAEKKKNSDLESTKEISKEIPWL